MKKSKKIIFTCIVVVILLCGMLGYYQRNYNKCVDLTGTDSRWKASLNINFAYNSVINIRPYIDYYDNSAKIPPSTIHVRIVVGDKEVYDKNLFYIQGQDKELGYYTDDFLSNFKFPTDVEKATMIVEHDGEEDFVLLKRVDLFE